MPTFLFFSFGLQRKETHIVAKLFMEETMLYLWSVREWESERDGEVMYGFDSRFRERERGTKWQERKASHTEREQHGNIFSSKYRK